MLWLQNHRGSINHVSFISRYRITTSIYEQHSTLQGMLMLGQIEAASFFKRG